MNKSEKVNAIRLTDSHTVDNEAERLLEKGLYSLSPFRVFRVYLDIPFMYRLFL